MADKSVDWALPTAEQVGELEPDALGEMLKRRLAAIETNAALPCAGEGNVIDKDANNPKAKKPKWEHDGGEQPCPLTRKATDFWSAGAVTMSKYCAGHKALARAAFKAAQDGENETRAQRIGAWGEVVDKLGLDAKTKGKGTARAVVRIKRIESLAHRLEGRKCKAMAHESRCTVDGTFLVVEVSRHGKADQAMEAARNAVMVIQEAGMAIGEAVAIMPGVIGE